MAPRIPNTIPKTTAVVLESSSSSPVIGTGVLGS